MNIKIRINRSKINIDLVILTLMYAAGSLGVVNQEIISPTNALLLKYIIIILGTLYFLNKYIRKYSLGNGQVLIPFVLTNIMLENIYGKKVMEIL